MTFCSLSGDMAHTVQSRELAASKDGLIHQRFDCAIALLTKGNVLGLANSLSSLKLSEDTSRLVYHMPDIAPIQCHWLA